MIWELLLLNRGEVVMEEDSSRGLCSRPAILKVCRQIDREAGHIFWSGNVITLEDYLLPLFINDWGLEVVHMIKNLKLLWHLCSSIRLDAPDLDFHQISTQDFHGLESIEIRLFHPDDCPTPGPLTRGIHGRDIVSVLMFLERLQQDSRLPRLAKSTYKVSSTNWGRREISLRLISDATPLREHVSISLFSSIFESPTKM